MAAAAVEAVAASPAAVEAGLSEREQLEAAEERREELELEEELRLRTRSAIALAAKEMEGLASYAEVDLERLEVIQRAHVSLTLSAHEEAEQRARKEVEDSLSGWQHAQATAASLANEVDEIDEELRARASEGERGVGVVERLVTDEKESLADGREKLATVHAAGVAHARASVDQRASETTTRGADEAEAKMADLRTEFVHTKLKNAVRLKKMQNENYALANHLAVADIGAATLKAEIESAEWQMYGGAGNPIHMQGVGPAPADPMMGVAVGEMRSLNAQLGGLEFELAETAVGFRGIMEGAVIEAVQRVHDEAAVRPNLRCVLSHARLRLCRSRLAPWQSSGNSATEQTALIHMLRAENAGRKLKLATSTTKVSSLNEKLRNLKADHEGVKEKVRDWSDKHEQQRVRADAAEKAGQIAAAKRCSRCNSGGVSKRSSRGRPRQTSRLLGGE